VICVSVQEKSLERCLEIIKGVPMAELRADLCRLTLPELERVVESHPNLLITCRIANSSIEFAKEQIITAIRKGAKYVDVEIEAPVDFLEYIKTYAQVNGAKLIISYHNFEGTQSIEELELIADICKRKGADIVKIVTTAHNISDAVTTLSLYRRGNWARKFTSNNYSEQKDVMLLAFSMGEAGQFSRYLSLKMGAPYTYVAADSESSTAPGQYTAAQMLKLLEKGKVPLDYRLSGKSVAIPCSKSVAQRAILAAAFAKGKSRLSNFEPCNDITGALEVIKKLGCSINALEGNVIEIESPGAQTIRESLMREKRVELFTGESGLLTRLLIPFATYLNGAQESGTAQRSVDIIGRGSILGRNLKGAAEAIESAGAHCSTTNGGYLPFSITGTVTGHKITINGKESSQTVSGFLMTLPLLPFDTVLEVIEPASTPYIDLTVDVATAFGVAIKRVEESVGKMVFEIKGGNCYTPCDIYLEPDWSSASFFAVAYAIASMGSGEEHVLKGMKIGTSQADEAILGILESAGAKIRRVEVGKSGLHNIYISTPESLKGFDFDATNAPDLFPVLTVLAMFCNGRSVIKGVNRLLEKESNRAESIFTEFTSIGAELDIKDDLLFIEGNMSNQRNLHPGATCGSGCPSNDKGMAEYNVHSHNDHRIAMSLIVASMFMEQHISLDEIKCIDKSFPSFLERL